MSSLSLQSYNKTLAWAASVLTMKMMVTHLMVIRVRLANRLEGKFGNIAEGEEGTPEAHPSNWVDPTGGGVFNMLYYAMGGFIQWGTTENDLYRLQCMERNATENEPYFLALATVWPYAASLPTWAPTALSAFVYGRLSHFFFYYHVRKQPFRAMAYTVGVVVNMTIAGNVLMNVGLGGKKKS